MPGFDAVAILKYPHLERINHVHHAGNSSGIVDGAAAVLIGSKAFGDKHGLKPRARIRATAKIGTDPTIMLTGPVPATEKILRESGMAIARPRPHRGQRGLLRRRPALPPGLRRRPRPRQRQRRRHRPRPPPRRHRRHDPRHRPRRARAHRQARRHPLRRQRHGRGHHRRDLAGGRDPHLAMRRLTASAPQTLAGARCGTGRAGTSPLRSGRATCRDDGATRSDSAGRPGRTPTGREPPSACSFSSGLARPSRNPAVEREWRSSRRRVLGRRGTDGRHRPANAR